MGTGWKAGPRGPSVSPGVGARFGFIGSKVESRSDLGTGTELWLAGGWGWDSEIPWPGILGVSGVEQEAWRGGAVLG
jgi:hypothetical protein